MTLQHPAGPPPSITEAAVSGNAVLAATDQNRLFDQHLGSLDDFETNIRGWGEACGADAGHGRKPRRPHKEDRPMSFPELPEGYDRHKDALAIVDPGASNPAGVAFAIHQACTQVIHEGGNQREDPAVRLMTIQLAFLVQGNSDLDFDEYRRLMDVCRTRAAERRNAPKPAPAPA